jgi:predicted kinase
MISFKQYTQINEGVNDPAIFKAVFLAGGPGSGKSFVVGKTALQPMGFKLINSDPAFESALKKAGLSTSPEDIASDRGQEARAKAKSLTKKQMELALGGRLGLVIDGTGKDLDKIMLQAIALRKVGYDTAMIFVNTDEATAQGRNQKRARTLPASMVSKMWNEVQTNLGAFQIFFGNSFHIIDNSEKSDYQSQINTVYKRILGWSRKLPTNSMASSWIKSQRKGMNEDITQVQVNDLEKFADKLLNKYDIDIEFTRHFVDRLNDPRNTPDIKISELQKLFKKIEKTKGKSLKSLGPDIEVVLKDMETDLNLPVIIRYNNGEFEVTHKTIMRKKNFATTNQKVEI